MLVLVEEEEVWAVATLVEAAVKNATRYDHSL